MCRQGRCGRSFLLRGQCPFKRRSRSNCCGRSHRIATLADDYDDRIVARFGGQTALEKIQDTGGRRQRQGVGEE
jgi:hypothetical protein